MREDQDYGTLAAKVHFKLRDHSLEIHREVVQLAAMYERLERASRYIPKTPHTNIPSLLKNWAISVYNFTVDMTRTPMVYELAGATGPLGPTTGFPPAGLSDVKPSFVINQSLHRALFDYLNADKSLVVAIGLSAAEWAQFQRPYEQDAQGFALRPTGWR
ncbi:MAG: hypothetical protein DI551_12165 [Micavibrio aeruginosavorus]|uniref:Uncharacterized protein n=1 Tax=Micavibrio aeruginosavorus TaxID=349221 RepID=A0A2W5PWJ5_9BACT|nr:MAG: hypothetical protein DI551_12165 [Micavibrio aeruginosavorus]